MTRIDFYTNVDDKYRFACRLCVKAVTMKQKIGVFTPDEQATTRFDQLLWTANPTGFVPHCRADHKLAAVTPVIIHHGEGDFPHDDILLNLNSQHPPFFSRFHRLIEIVSREEEDIQAGRERFRFYRDRGYAITHHDMGEAHD